MRYNQLLPLIAYHKPKTIVEVGTWNGLRAIMMATEALKHGEVHYIGFDLFEDATPDSDERELNVKAHSTLADVESRLREFQERNPGFTYRLIKGDTRTTLITAKSVDKATDASQADLAFIDGGHSIETIRNDYEALKNSKIVVLDDYYTGRDTEKHGCNSLIKDLDALVLPHEDPVKGGGKVQMAVIPSEAWPGPRNVVVKTKNCVPDEEIQANIKYAQKRIENWVVECKPHQETAVMVSGGPSFKEYINEISTQEGRIVCVKHAHDILIETGVIPWACMLLDPRDHVQDFIENPHPEVTYFVASMCHPSTVDRLLEKNANVWGYHAHVGAGEEKVINKGIMIGGGSTSAVRGVSVLHTLGFRNFKMYGYDSCYEKVDKTKKDKKGRDKYIKVEVSGKKFWTDSELLAQAQDFDKLMDQSGDLQLDVVGEGMIPHLWSVKRRVLPDFRDVLSG